MTTARQTHVLNLIARAAQSLSGRRFRRAKPRAEKNEAANLFAALASARCSIAYGPPVTVADVIGDDALYYDHRVALEAQGVALTAGRRGRRGLFRDGKTSVFVVPEAAKRHLLWGSGWSPNDVARVLLDVPGATRRQRSVGNRRRRGIDVPLTVWATLARASRPRVSPLPTPVPGADHAGRASP